MTGTSTSSWIGAGPVEAHSEPAPGWWQIRLDADARTVSIPAGVHVDLGASAKAFAADRAARRIAAVARLRCAGQPRR